jgi:hypothetical protein
VQRERVRVLWVLSLPILVLLAALSLAIVVPHPVQAGDDGQSPQPGWRLAQPITYENLTVFPVVSAQDADTSAFATLDEALASGDVVVTEQGNYLRRTREALPLPFPQPGAQVNQLVLVNRGKRQLLLLAGEVVSGGNQDRIIGKDRIVPAGAAPLPLDVFCVEHGRWTGESANFAAANLMVHPSVRAKAAVEQNQNEVWAAVRGDTQSTLGGAAGGVAGGRIGSAPSALSPPINGRSLDSVIALNAPTQAYAKIYKSSPIGASVETFSQEVDRRFHRANSGTGRERVVGVIVAYGGEVTWSDVFASSQLFDAYWPKLLRSYVVEALTRTATRETVSLIDARDFLRPATGHIREESDPGIYRWRERSEGQIAEIELQALAPKPIGLHWLRVLRAK